MDKNSHSNVQPAPRSQVSRQPKKSTKKRLTTTVAIVAVALIVGAIVTTWLSGAMISRADYDTAATKWNAMAKSYTALVDASSDTNTTDVVATANAITTAADTFSTQLNDFGQLKAIKEDKDLAAAYASFKKDADNELAVSRGSAEYIRATKSCSDPSTSQECIRDLNAVTAPGVPAVVSYAKATANYVDDPSAANKTSLDNAEAQLTAEADKISKAASSSNKVLTDELNKKLR